jgi:membrane protein required for colicin V production
VTLLDGLVLGVLLLSMAIGVWRGVVREVFAIVAWIAGVASAWLFGDWAAQQLSAIISHPLARVLVAYAGMFVALFVVVSAAGWLLRSLFKAVGLSGLDRGLGLVFGAARGALVITIAAIIASMTSAPSAGWWREALVAQPLTQAVIVARAYLPEAISRRITIGEQRGETD